MITFLPCFPAGEGTLSCVGGLERHTLRVFGSRELKTPNGEREFATSSNSNVRLRSGIMPYSPPRPASIVMDIYILTFPVRFHYDVSVTSPLISVCPLSEFWLY
jgi:hypothetical protein